MIHVYCPHPVGRYPLQSVESLLVSMAKTVYTGKDGLCFVKLKWFDIEE